MHQTDNLYSCQNNFIWSYCCLLKGQTTGFYLLQLWHLCCHTRLLPLYEEGQRLALEEMMSYVLEELREEMMMLQHHLKLAPAPPEENQQKPLYLAFWSPMTRIIIWKFEGFKLLHRTNNKAITWSRQFIVKWQCQDRG